MIRSSESGVLELKYRTVGTEDQTGFDTPGIMATKPNSDPGELESADGIGPSQFWSECV